MHVIVCVIIFGGYVEFNDFHSYFQLHHLSAIGGNSVDGVTRRLLKTVFTNALATRCNFIGKGGKVAFASTKLKTF